MTREDIDQEFNGQAFSIGCSFGYADGHKGWVHAIQSIARDLKRDLTARERAEFAAGWHAGIRDRVNEDRRQAERVELVAAMDEADLPF